MPNDEIREYEEYLEANELAYSDLLATYEALSSFLTDYETLKNKQHLTQKEIAKSMKTTQSAISRLESMKTNPSYKQLVKMTKAVNGSLLVTPMGNMTATVHYDLQDAVVVCAGKENMETKDWLDMKLNEAVKQEKENSRFILSPKQMSIADVTPISSTISQTNYDMYGEDIAG